MNMQIIKLYIDDQFHINLQHKYFYYKRKYTGYEEMYTDNYMQSF